MQKNWERTPFYFWKLPNWIANFIPLELRTINLKRIDKKIILFEILFLKYEWARENHQWKNRTKGKNSSNESKTLLADDAKHEINGIVTGRHEEDEMTCDMAPPVSRRNFEIRMLRKQKKHTCVLNDPLGQTNNQTSRAMFVLFGDILKSGDRRTDRNMRK